jgi:hypothetical protein
MKTMLVLIFLSLGVWHLKRWMRNNPEITQAIARRIAGPSNR